MSPNGLSERPKSGPEVADIVRLLEGLSPAQLDVIQAIIARFSDELVSERLRSDFLSEGAFEYFGVRLAAHHAYSSSVLKKENFEHILEEAFQRTGATVKRADSMTVRGADLTVDGVTLSLKTEAAKKLRLEHITISKLMEAAWIKQVAETDDIPGFVQSMVMPHFDNYDRIFILRCYRDRQRGGFIRYDLREIPKEVLKIVGNLSGADFTALTRTRTTSAEVTVDGKRAFKFRLDGSDDKLTINYLDVDICPLHAWWSLAAPD